MVKPISTAKDGTIFVNFMRPVVKWMKNAPPAAKPIALIAVAAVAVGATGYVIYKKVKKSDTDSTKTPKTTT